MWPIEHLWRGFAFEYSSTRHACYFSASVIPLYIQTDRYLVGLIGNRLAGGKLFVFTPDAYEASAASLRKAVLEEGVPFLNGYACPEDILRNIVPYENSPHHEILAYTHTFVGSYAKAIPEIEKVISEYERVPRNIAEHYSEEVKAHYSLNKTLLKLLQSDPGKARQLVQELEAKTIVNYRLKEIK